MELFLLYLWLKLDLFSSICTLLFMGGGFLGGFLFCISADSDHPGDVKGRSFAKKLLIVALICGPIAMLLPSKKDAAILVGGHFALQAVQSPEAAKIISVLRLKANELLDEQLNPKEKK